MRYILFLLSVIALSSAVCSAADTAAAAAPAQITWSGFVDAYYSKNFNSPLTSANALRNFDISENQFAFSLAELVIQKAASPVGFRMDLDFGPTNDIVQGVAPYGTTPYNTLSILQQAYLTAVLPVGSGLTVDVGKFVTHMGYEVIESKITGITADRSCLPMRFHTTTPAFVHRIRSQAHSRPPFTLSTAGTHISITTGRLHWG